MSVQQENFAVPRAPLGRTKPKRRSSTLPADRLQYPATWRDTILKTARPFDELQNVVQSDERVQKDRRVSFANTIKIKEFCKELPTQPSAAGESSKPQDLEPYGEVRTVVLPEVDETYVQISTPVGKKRRRLSGSNDQNIARLSIIPKLDRSFAVADEDDFEVYGMDEDAEATTAPKHEITLIEEALELPNGMDFLEKDFCAALDQENQILLGHPGSPPSFSRPIFENLAQTRENSDMDMTCNDSGTLDPHLPLIPCAKVLAQEFLKGLQAGDCTEQSGPRLPTAVPPSSDTKFESCMSFTCVESECKPSECEDSHMSLSFTCMEPDLPTNMPQPTDETTESNVQPSATKERAQNHETETAANTNRGPPTGPQFEDHTEYTCQQPKTKDGALTGLTHPDEGPECLSSQAGVAAGATVGQGAPEYSNKEKAASSVSHSNLLSASAAMPGSNAPITSARESATTTLNHPNFGDNVQLSTYVSHPMSITCEEGTLPSHPSPISDMQLTTYDSHPMSMTCAENTALVEHCHDTTTTALNHLSSRNEVQPTCTTYESHLMSMTCAEFEIPSREATEVSHPHSNSGVQFTMYESHLMSMTCDESISEPDGHNSTYTIAPCTTDTKYQVEVETIIPTSASDADKLDSSSHSAPTAPTSTVETSLQSALPNIPVRKTTVLDPFRRPHLPPKLAKHSLSKAKPSGKPLVMASPMLCTPQKTPLLLPPQGSASWLSLGIHTPAGPLHTSLHTRPTSRHVVPTADGSTSHWSSRTLGGTKLSNLPPKSIGDVMSQGTAISESSHTLQRQTESNGEEERETGELCNKAADMLSDNTESADNAVAPQAFQMETECTYEDASLPTATEISHAVPSTLHTTTTLSDTTLGASTTAEGLSNSGWESESPGSTNWLNCQATGTNDTCNFSLVSVSPENEASAVVENTADSAAPEPTRHVPQLSLVTPLGYRPLSQFGMPEGEATAIVREMKPALTISQLGKALQSLKSNAKGFTNKSLVIETPEAVPVEHAGNAAADPHKLPTLDWSMHISSRAEVSQANISMQLGQSVMVSPSAFNRLLGALKSEQSMFAETIHISSPPEMYHESADLPTTEQAGAHSCSPACTCTCTSETPQNETFSLSTGDTFHGSPELQSCEETDTASVAVESPLTADKSSVQCEVAPNECENENIDKIVSEEASEAVHSSMSTPVPEFETDTPSIPQKEQKLSSKSFGTYLQELHSSLLAAEQGLRLRLCTVDYCSAHEEFRTLMEFWHRTTLSFLSCVETLLRYGERCGLFQSRSWDDSGTPGEVPTPPIWTEDIGGHRLRKAQWLWELIQIVEKLHPLIEKALTEAARLYPWGVLRWSEKTVELRIQPQLTVTLELVLGEGGTEECRGCQYRITAMSTQVNGDTEIDGRQKEIIEDCKNTNNITEMLWRLTVRDN